MTGTPGLADTTPSAKQAAVAVIEGQPHDASLDEIVEALWAWGMATPEGTAVCSTAANRLLAINPAELMMESRAARHAVMLGVSRQIALDIVHALPEQALLEDILVAVVTCHWPDDSVD